MVAQLKKGVLEFCVLHVLSARELYGYEIMKCITASFPDTSEQTVYTILRRLLSDGYTQCYTKEPASVPPRKYYRLTDAGRDYLARCAADWADLQGAVAAILELGKENEK